MLGALLVVIVMNLIGTLPIAYVGYLIAYRDRRDLIAGYRESKYKYPEKFGKLFGFGVFGSAFVIFSFSIILAFELENQFVKSYGWLIALPPIVTGVYGALRYRT
jgi:formate/nitrite transporter FocA (FNT family)